MNAHWRFDAKAAGDTHVIEPFATDALARGGAAAAVPDAATTVDAPAKQPGPGVSSTRPVRVAATPGRRAPVLQRWHKRLLAGSAAALGVLALTYSAASALVNGAAGSSAARGDYATVIEAASAEYRRARAECLALPFDRRDACVAAAHANETKLRTVAGSAARKQLSQLRRKSDEMLVAARGLDSIVIEPACNIVTRGSASVCEIQVRGARPEAPEGIAATRSAPTAARRGEDRSFFARWTPPSASATAAERDHYFSNVATLVSP